MPQQVPGLIVLPRPPQAETGTGQRSLLLIEAAARLGPVHVVLIDGSGRHDALAALPGVASITTIASTKILPRTPLARRLVGPSRLLAPGWAYAPDRAFRAALAAHAEQTGARYVLFRYARLFCAAGLVPTPQRALLVDVDDRDDQKYASRLERLPAGGLARLAGPLVTRLRRLLARRLGKASHVWFAGTGDVLDLPGAATASVIPNVPHDAPETPSAVDPDGCTALFVGTFAHQPNRDGLCWFLDTAWARVTQQVPQAELRVVGFGDWASLAAGYEHLQGVRFIGAVEDLDAEYARATLAVCPMREGGGSKIKVIEAAAQARPIVATSFALRGFEDGLPALARTADSPADLAAACAAYLADPQIAARDGAALRQAQQRHYSRTAIQDRIRQDIRTTLGLPATEVPDADQQRIES